MRLKMTIPTEIRVERRQVEIGLHLVLELAVAPTIKSVATLVTRTPPARPTYVSTTVHLLPAPATIKCRRWLVAPASADVCTCTICTGCGSSIPSGT
jgi:hypothetical protein